MKLPFFADVLRPTMMAWVALALCFASGCSLIPEARQRDVLHNPFPQMKRIAILPFFNQSSEPTVDTDAVAEAYYAALQAVPGFEVLPVGVTKAQWLQYAIQNGEPRTGQDFQRLAQQMGVEAIVVGSVTDFDAYYPPRIGMTVHWYAANEAFHPIPTGYGLPWGTEAEKHIPRRIAREAEFELARSQLATQTPFAPGADTRVTSNDNGNVRQVSHDEPIADPIPDDAMAFDDSMGNLEPPVIQHDPNSIPVDGVPSVDGFIVDGAMMGTDSMGTGPMGTGPMAEAQPSLPPDWPDPTDLIPDPPSPVRPVATALNHEPVISHTRLYRGDDPYFTKRLTDFVETGDDARPDGWTGYLRRSDDFIRFSCHLHITEMLESRGGSDQSDLILRWPLSRY